MSAAEFSEAARAAIYAAGLERCAGCGTSSPLTCQHRRARGRGGSSDPALGHPSNGVPLCGSGTTGCHGWAESEPLLADALGWRLDAGDSPYAVPFYVRAWRGFRLWLPDATHVYVDEDAVGPERRAAVAFLSTWVATRQRNDAPPWLRPPKGIR